MSEAFRQNSHVATTWSLASRSARVLPWFISGPSLGGPRPIIVGSLSQEQFLRECGFAHPGPSSGGPRPINTSHSRPLRPRTCNQVMRIPAEIYRLCARTAHGSSWSLFGRTSPHQFSAHCLVRTFCANALSLSSRQGFPAIFRLAPLGRFLASSEVYPSGNNALVLSDRQGSFVNRSPLVGCRQRLQMSLYDCFCRPINLPGQSRARFFGSADV